MAPHSDSELLQGDLGQKRSSLVGLQGGGAERLLGRASALLSPPLGRLSEFSVLQGVSPHLLGEGIPRGDGWDGQKQGGDQETFPRKRPQHGRTRNILLIINPELISDKERRQRLEE